MYYNTVEKIFEGIDEYEKSFKIDFIGKFISNVYAKL